MSEPELYFNRELSWLKFNERVLEEAVCTDTPLYERLRFVSIYASNLDEFYMVRIGSLKDQSLLSGNIAENKTRMKPEEQIRAANAEVKRLCTARDNAYFDIMTSLSALTCYHTSFKALNGGDRRVVKVHFETEVLPVLSPQIIDSRHPFPHLENKQIYIGVRLKSKDKPLYGIIPLPRELERIYTVPGSKAFLLLEDIVLHYAETAFDIYDIEAKAIFRVTRNADLEYSGGMFDEEIEYREFMQALIKKRRKLSPVRLETNSNADEALTAFFVGKLSLSKSQCFLCHSPLDLSFVSQIEEMFEPLVKDQVTYAPLRPQWPASLTHGNISAQIVKTDLLLSYPYDSMRPLVDVIREASEDSSVVSIKMTLYRIGSQSQIVQYLCAAAENGKDVIVIVELRARFDEQNNINWAKVMEESGCKLLYGVDDYKIHGKLVLITRRTRGRPQHLVNISTGNYNESTARLYADLSFFTTDPILCSDAVQFFRNMEIGNLHGSYRRLLVAPATLKTGILDLIAQEIGKAAAGSPARIILKMNSLTDKDIIDKLVAASQAGVKVSLIIRGICCLRPGVAGFTDNIEVRSIVGRFLEHARIFCFGTGEQVKLYIGSADMMTRNTERRVEILTPIVGEQPATQLLELLSLQLRDNVKARVLHANGDYTLNETGGERLDSQIALFEQAYRQAEAAAAQEKPAQKELLADLYGLFNSGKRGRFKKK